MHFYKKCSLHLSMVILLMLGADSSRAELLVENAWVKLAPPSIQMGAAYMKISNQHQQVQTITNVNADCCAVAMLHLTRRKGDQVIMDHLEQLSVPAQSSIQLQPGDLHIMLMQPHYPLLIDTPVRITFTFSDGSQQKIDTIVKKDGQ